MEQAWRTAVMAAAGGTLLAGCEQTAMIRPGAERGPAPPVVLVDGRAIPDDDLRARTAEIGGGVAIEELVLERALEDACRRAGVTVSDADARAEREDLVASVVREVGGERVAVGELLDRIRAERGLGPERFGALLRRNAMLRALVRGEVRVADDEVRLAHEIRTGERYRARLIVVATREEASALRERLVDAGVRLSNAFGAEAVRSSLHPTAGAGGDLGEVSPVDPAFPEALRSAVRETGVGGLSPVVPVGPGWGIALVEAAIPRDHAAELDEARASEIRQEIRRRKERLAMERLAERLVREADVVVVDPSLGWSFRTRTGRTP